MRYLLVVAAGAGMLTACVTLPPPAPAPGPYRSTPDLAWVGDREAWSEWTVELESTCALDLERPSVTGSYASTWGEVHLDQRGDRVVGSYACCGGGTIEGTLVRDALEFRWTEPGRAGRGIFKRVAPDRLAGTWGWSGHDDGGPWELVRAR